MFFKVTVFAVDGNKIFGLQQRVHYLVFFTAGVSRNVDMLQTFVNNVRAFAVKIVYYSVNELFVTGDWRRGYDYRIVTAHGYGGIITVRHTRKRAHRLALTARGNDQNFAVAHILYFRNVHENAFGNFYFAYLFRRFYHVKHTSARERDLSSVLYGKVYYLLQAMYVGRKSRHYNAPFHVFVKQPVQRSAHGCFAHGKARALDIGAFTHIQQHAARAYLRDGFKVNRCARNGS